MWLDGTPRSQANAFTGYGYTEADRAKLTSRWWVLNGKSPLSKDRPADE